MLQQDFAQDHVVATSDALPKIVALLERDVRECFDLATSHLVRTIHSESIEEALRLAVAEDVKATVVSVGWSEFRREETLRGFLSQSTRVSSLVFAETTHVDSDILLFLGYFGVRALVDLRTPPGWSVLREKLTDAADGHLSDVRRQIEASTANAPLCTRAFFADVLIAARNLNTAKAFAVKHGSSASTLASRFWRAGLPSPKRYLAETRFLYAAAMMSDRRLSIGKVADALGYSSPQSFSRQLRERFGLTAGAFRYRYSSGGLIGPYIREMVTPHLEKFIHLTCGIRRIDA